MKVIDVLKNNSGPIFSLEFTPPAKGHGIKEIFEPLDKLVKYNPQFINVTQHQPFAVYREHNGVIEKIHRNKRPGTVGICASIKHKYNIEPVAHFICGGFTAFETEDALIDLNYLGLQNIFVIRGDTQPGNKQFVPTEGGHTYSSQLVEQLVKMNKGEYLEPIDHAVPTDFCIGVAGYPEKHYEAPNFDKDLHHLKLKVDAGADYIITQMFFDVNHFKNFVEKARKFGITVPILPGIKPLTTRSQLTVLPREFGTHIPNGLVEKVESCKTKEEVFKAGIAHAVKMIEELLDFGAPGIHLFTMGRAKAAEEILKQF